MASVRFDGLTKRFGEVVAVSNLDLEIPDREFLVLVGPSGCGKSTILRLLAGLEAASAGDIYIGSTRVNDVPPKDRDIAMVFQSYALYPHMTVFDNMAFGLKLRGLASEAIRTRVEEAAQVLGIVELLHRKPGQLSGGQRQRVALGRAIVRDPAAFLLDEPLSNLDAKLRVQTRAEISKLHQRLGATFVYVTHDQTEAMTMASRIAVLDGGVLQQVGPPQELYDHPANAFVAGFIGSPAMNFFSADLSCSDERVDAVADGFSLPITGQLAEALRSRDCSSALLGIRPENIHDIEHQPTSIQPTPVKALVEVIEPMGNERFLHLDVNGNRFLARVDPRCTAIPGEWIDVVFDVGRVHAFDLETELAIAAD
jgi:multiple sugar transport system ATP-binding protein